jgi:hypothetical protein
VGTDFFTVEVLTLKAEWPAPIAGGQPSKVGSRADAILLRSDLSVAPRFLWECLTNRIVSWVSAPAASNVACGFPALRSPVCFSSRVMRPIVLGQLSGEMRFGELDSR